MRAYNNPNRLPFFPTPYPGESLYSVLCRYHVRSGNATNRKTILQLFGVFGSLCSTLLLPSMLNCLKSWVDAESGINAEYIFRNNTAYSLCTLRNYHDYYRFFPNGDFSVPTFSKKDYCWPFRQCLIRHPSNKLRYCPACAAVQKKLYGEAYWQILPQLDGVEYCPIHQTRIATTAIGSRDLLYTFHPADIVIDNTTPSYPDYKSTWYHSSHTVLFPELFVNMGKAISHLRDHLSSYGGIWFLLNKYRYSYEIGNRFWQSKENEREKLFGNSPPSLVCWLTNKNNDPFERKYLYFSDFTLSEHAMMISMLSSSAKTFFTE